MTRILVRTWVELDPLEPAMDDADDALALVKGVLEDRVPQYNPSASLDETDPLAEE